MTGTEKDTKLAMLHAELAATRQLLEIHEATVLRQSKQLEETLTQLSDQNGLLEMKNAELVSAIRRVEEATKAKSEFLTKMSHELRTPLNAIIGYAELIGEDAEDNGHDVYVPDLLKIVSAGQHQLALINDILDLAKIEAGKMTVNIELVEFGPLLREVIHTVQPLATKNGNELTLEVPGEFGSVQIDPMKVRQILFNLVSNSCKFTTNGQVSVTVSRKELNRQIWAELVVADSGIGMTQDQLARVFDEFAQAEDSTSKTYGGTGLGLAICKKMVDLMLGTIEAESEFGSGTRFIVSLPVLDLAA